jgi:hypothetical protein
VETSGLSVGVIVPVGYYDRNKGAGCCLRTAGAAARRKRRRCGGGHANGDGQPDDLNASSFLQDSPA